MSQISADFEVFRAWYSRMDVLFSMLPYTKNKEFACLVPKGFANPQRSARNFRAHNTQSLTFILRKLLKYHEKRQFYNLYISNAGFIDGFPPLTAALDKRSAFLEQVRSELIGQISSYDLFIDIDTKHADEMPEAKESAITIKALFDKYRLKYSLRFSGRGFHFLVANSNFNGLGLHYNPEVDGNIYTFYDNISKAMHEKYTEMIDLGLNDSRRLVKLPYSLACYGDGFYACLPLRQDKDLLNFDRMDYNVNNFSLLLQHSEKFKPAPVHYFNQSYTADVPGFLNYFGVL
jgi:hypothetical protein